MDHEGGGEKHEVGMSGPKKPKRSCVYWGMLLLRFLALCATVLATLIMSLNKESKTMVVATIGTNPINATVTAKFQNTPAFVFFVIVNSIASLYNLVMLLVDLFGYKFGFKGIKLLIMTVLDMGTVALVSAGTGAAASMAELGKKGNSHARWNKICDKFERYCDRGGGALIASLVGICLLMALNVMSTIAIHKNARAHQSISN
ncbi:Uncharacterized protein family UPF0497 [Macleaya cordata]|uniref:CASP-like protein n=1 Tax=Macleaya cordata TaxID=56857 RepID=A0A200QMC9_MACCD|nr:Uncharacterized protein family UPF0497 [Macleaya cordata]